MSEIIIIQEYAFINTVFAVCFHSGLYSMKTGRFAGHLERAAYLSTQKYVVALLYIYSKNNINGVIY